MGFDADGHLIDDELRVDLNEIVNDLSRPRRSAKRFRRQAEHR
jgi:hypothetical protein